ncbi:uncharacterized protein LOC114321449 [Camellia sinensis]|uniref:uncharacterized protein LOC114321449 n=1 Tax=Camellia sinensis TaxID=4442 RepID=UPI0010367C29|nr:uncharacterized protein LOC114321449 [Camellia sinensis]
MPGVDSFVVQHRLNVDPKCKPIIQKSRRLAPEHSSAVVEEVDRLLEGGEICEVIYPTWLSNTMVVKKNKGSWHLKGDYAAKNDRIAAYMTMVNSLLAKFDHYELNQITQDQNTHADALAFLASAINSEIKRTIEVGFIPEPSITSSELVQINVIEPEPSWIDPIVAFLSSEQLPMEKKEAHKLRNKALRYYLDPQGKLYKKSFSGLYLKCVHPDKVEELLTEIHEAEELNSITSPWPFAQWGLNIVRPLPRAPGNKRFLIVTTDYFTKWVKVETLTHIQDIDIKRFVWKNIITRFGIPRALISDNGTQFDCGVYRELCNTYGIQPYFSLPAYPQSNGQAEASNKVILDGIKKRLEKAKEIDLPTMKSKAFDMGRNDMMLALDLTLIEERRDCALACMGRYQQQLAKSYNQHVQLHRYTPRELVLKKVLPATKNPADGKLGPNWDSPYQVDSITRIGAYRLKDMTGRSLPRPWNSTHLRKFYHLATCTAR